ncbi:hypothetical protein V8G54_012788, partial [Vigna mungo]
VVSCSGAYRDCSLCVVCNGIEIKEQAELQGIKGMWSLRSSTDDPFDTFVVVSFISETRVLTMNHEIELEETEMEGFCSQVQTLFCHDAVHNQLVQITGHFKFCLSSTTRELRNEWFAPSDYSVNVATANATQPRIIWVNWYRTSIDFGQKYHILAAGKINCSWVQLLCLAFDMISRSLLVVLVWHPIKFYIVAF